jgi:hypothetical protein
MMGKRSRYANIVPDPAKEEKAKKLAASITNYFRGVSYDPKVAKWYARYWDKTTKKMIFLGYHATENDAKDAYQRHKALREFELKNG